MDPARASVAPETDLVRAVYEGLTELDGRTLEALPAAAASWNASTDHREWTFRIRPDAKWSNGDPVTANDFIRSWTRAATLADASPNAELFGNIVGLKLNYKKPEAVETSRSVSALSSIGGRARRQTANTPANSAGNNSVEGPQKQAGNVGLSAPDERTVVVKLVEPNREFPRLVAHPIFRPIFGADVSADMVSPAAVTNGAFRIAEANADGVVLERSSTYWNNAAVKLERVVFVPAESGEQALEAYRAGKVDVVTNAQFSPLVLKLLAQYDDFRRRPFAALNVYDLNVDRPAFRDRRVREALAISVERERLTEGELEGTTQPALNYLPFGSSPKRKIVQDRQRARDLMEEAGYPNGEDFPSVTLTVNRNDAQQRIARSVAEMWKQNLNINVDVVVKEAADIERDRETGDYDIARRGVVMPSADEASNMRRIFGSRYQSDEPEANETASNSNGGSPPKGTGKNANSNSNTFAIPSGTPAAKRITVADEDDALFELTAIPLYFPSSYSLVKPYILGFETNVLDASLLHEVFINPDWKPNG
ncbi:oligopeptide ABC transporter substrate-binding protein OppA [soil metagenome]